MYIQLIKQFSPAKALMTKDQIKALGSKYQY